MKIENLVYNADYNSGPLARIDWIAGGNFDGYIYRITLRFSEENNMVTRIVKIIEKSRYDGKISTQELKGTFFETDKRAIMCEFGEFRMHGKI